MIVRATGKVGSVAVACQAALHRPSSYSTAPHLTGTSRLDNQNVKLVPAKCIGSQFNYRAMYDQVTITFLPTQV